MTGNSRAAGETRFTIRCERMGCHHNAELEPDRHEGLFDFLQSEYRKDDYPMRGSGFGTASSPIELGQSHNCPVPDKRRSKTWEDTPAPWAAYCQLVAAL